MSKYLFLMLMAVIGNSISQEDKTIVVLGSSSAAGFCASSYFKGWVGQLQTSSALVKNTSVINLARSGTLSSHSLPKKNGGDPGINVEKAVFYKANTILLAYPSNDIFSNVPIEKIVDNFEAINSYAKTNNAKIIVQSMQPRKGNFEQWEKLKSLNVRLLSIYKGCYVDVFSGLADEESMDIKKEYACGDGIHLNDNGHSYIFRKIEEKLRDGSC